MPNISESFKKKIESSAFIKQLKEAKNAEEFIGSWIELCREELIDGFLDYSYDEIFLDKLNAFRRDKPVLMSRMADEVRFFTDKLNGLNQQFNWFNEEAFTLQSIENAACYYVDEHENQKIKEKLKKKFDTTVEKWFLEIIVEAQKLEKTARYTKIFELFFIAYYTRLIDCSLYRKNQKASIIETKESIQYNFSCEQLFHTFIYDYCKQHALLQDELEIFAFNPFIQQCMHAADNYILEREYQSFLWPSLLESEHSKTVKIELGNHTITDIDQEKLLAVVSKQSISQIDIWQHGNLVFSYKKPNEITNNGYLDHAHMCEYNIIRHLINRKDLSSENKMMFTGLYGYSLTDWELTKLVQKSIENKKDVINLDEEAPFSHFGEKGINIFLEQLDRQFEQQLSQNKINKGYNLHIPSQNNSKTFVTDDALSGIIHYLEKQLKKNEQYVFSCEQLYLYLDKNKQNNLAEQLVLLFKAADRTKIKLISIDCKQLDDTVVIALRQALKDIRYTQINLINMQDMHLACELEGINHDARQVIVPEIKVEEVYTINKQAIALQPSPITAAKIQNLLKQEVVLNPLQGKVGIQNQFKMEKKVVKQTETTILKSWQIEEDKEVKKESKQNIHFMYDDERTSLISLSDVKSAMDPSNNDHDKCKKKLGKEIVNFQFKGRNLLDLWGRLTGDIALTEKKEAQWSERQKYFDYLALRYFSTHIPTRFSLNALRRIVEHPHLFQDGITLDALPEKFHFDMGALYVGKDKDLFDQKEEGNVFAQQWKKLLNPNKPSSLYALQLIKSKLPAQQFYQHLSRLITPNQAWHIWQNNFSALNVFNGQGIGEINSLFTSVLPEKESQRDLLLAYLGNAIFYYYQQKMTQQNLVIQSDMQQFEFKSDENYKHGMLTSLSNEMVISLSLSLRKQIHDKIVAIYNHYDYQTFEEHSSETSTILMNSLLKNKKIIIDFDKMSPILKLIGIQNINKLIELVAAEHPSVVINVIHMLQSTYNTYGESGIISFTQTFLTPVMNLAELANEHSQKSFIKYLQMTLTQYHWWKELTKQHTEQSGLANFAELMQAYQAFLDELRTMGLENHLLVPCPVQGAGHFSVVLNRILTVLKSVKNPKVQMQHLNLDWSAGGVVEAVTADKEKPFHYVSPEMHLDELYEKRFNHYLSTNNRYSRYEKYGNYNAELIDYSFLTDSKYTESVKELYTLTMTAFYRHLGSTKYSAPLPIYQELLDKMTLPTQYKIVHDKLLEHHTDGGVYKEFSSLNWDSSPLIMSAIMRLILFATTSPRALDNMSTSSVERQEQLNALIMAFYECARDRSIIKTVLIESYKFVDIENAVIYDHLMRVIDHATNFCHDKYDFDYKHNEQGIFPHLTIQEITWILQLVAKSEDVFVLQHGSYASSLPSYFFILMNEKEDSRIRQTYHGYPLSLVNGCSKKYQYYFIAALQRFKNHNANSDFLSFILLLGHLQKQKLSYENQGRLTRLMGLVQLSYQNMPDEVPRWISLLKSMHQLQEEYGEKALDRILIMLSSMLPDGPTNLTLQKITAIVKHYSKKISGEKISDLHQFINQYLPSYLPDACLDEVTDIDFYGHASDIESKFKGLGIHYTLIKQVVLHFYPVKLGDNKKQTWNDFLLILQRLNTNEQTLLLKALIEIKRKNLDLTTLNSWLNMICSPASDCATFDATWLANINETLLHHQHKTKYQEILKKWLVFPGKWEESSSHSAFIKILNILAVKEGTEQLDTYYETAYTFSSLFHHYEKNNDWSVHLLSWVNIADENKISSVKLESILKCLNELYSTEIKDYHERDQFGRLLLTWISHPENTLTITNQLADLLNGQNTIQIQSMMWTLGQAACSDISLLYEKLMQLELGQLQTLAKCYQHRPALAKERLIAWIKKDIIFDTLIKEHNRDPHHERDKQKVREQFDNDLVWPYLHKIANDDKSRLTTNYQRKLYDQYQFINEVGEKEYQDLSLQEIKSRLHQYRELLKSAKSEERTTFLLMVLALVREAIYKKSEPPAILWPTPVQMLALLASMNHQLESEPALFMQMATGEGKSLVAVLNSLLLWTQGTGVMIVTHRSSFAERDANQYASLYQTLDIESEHLSANLHRSRHFFKKLLREDKDKHKPEFDGVYYVEFSDLALIRQQQILDEGKDMSHLSFVIDEADEILLHLETENNLTQGSQDKTHPHASIFEALAAYLDEQGDAVSLNINLKNVIDYLREHYRSTQRLCDEPELLQKLPSYLQAVWRARSLKNKENYIIKCESKEENKYYAAVLINDKDMPKNVTFTGLIHQALHGYLNYQAKKHQVNQHFDVSPEMQLYSSISPDAQLKWMRATGPFVALSATIGSSSERKEMQEQHGLEFIKLPKMQKTLRVDYPEHFCKDEKSQLESVRKICLHYVNERTLRKSRAVLITVDTIQFAETLHNYLTKHCPKAKLHLLHAGMDNVDDSKIVQIEREAGQSGHILIAMSGLTERGFDLKLKTAFQVVVIATDLKSADSQRQKKGRTSRINPKTGKRNQGKFYGVYNLEKELLRYPHLKADSNKIDINPAAFEEQEFFAHYQAESTLRLYRQLAGVVKDAIQEHFNRCWHRIFEKELLIQQRDDIMSLYKEVLSKTTTIVPCKFFTDESKEGKQSRQQYNHNLLLVYNDLLEKMMPIVRNNPEITAESEIQLLRAKIDKQQNQLLNIHRESSQMSPDKPSIKVYKKWKPGIYYNAYLDSGKQGIGNYLLNSLYAWKMATDDKSELSIEKQRLEEKITAKKKEQSSFFSQLDIMIKTLEEKADYISQYKQIYRQYLPKTSLAKDDGIESKEHSLGSLSKMNDIESKVTDDQWQVVKKLSTGANLRLVNDTTLYAGAKIVLTSKSRDDFMKLQQVLTNAYEKLQINIPIVFSIHQKNQGTYELTLDFTNFTFDTIDRHDLFEQIANSYQMPLENIALLCPPSTATMKLILREFDIGKHLDKLPHKCKFYFKHISDHISRGDYYKNVFHPLINSLASEEMKIESVSQKARTIQRAMQEVTYLDRGNNECRSSPITIHSFEDAERQANKYQALDYIKTNINEFSKSPFTNDILLCKQQLECFLQLSEAIARSTSKESLGPIYDTWKKEKIIIFNRETTIDQLMKQRAEKTKFLVQLKSPDCITYCSKLEELIEVNQVTCQFSS